jgi:hypothetical protein
MRHGAFRDNQGNKMTQLNFDATQHQPSSFEPMPLDWYDLLVSGSEIKPTSKGDGMRLNLEITVQSGRFMGRKMFQGYNIQNPNSEAVRISMGQLSALAHAVGVLQVQDSTQLHGIPFKGRLKVRKAEPNSGYDDQNELTACKPASDPQPTNTVAAQPQVGGMPGGAAPSWSAPGAGFGAQPAGQAAPAGFGMQPQAQQQPQQFAPQQQPQQFAPQAQAAQPAQAAPGGMPAQPWQNGAPTQPQPAAAQQAQQPAQPDHPAVAAAQQQQPSFIQPQQAAAQPVAQQPSLAPANAQPQAQPNAQSPAPGTAQPSWAQGASAAPAQTPSWAQ